MRLQIHEYFLLASPIEKKKVDAFSPLFTPVENRKEIIYYYIIIIIKRFLNVSVYVHTYWGRGGEDK